MEFLVITIVASIAMMAGMQFNFYEHAAPQNLALAVTTVSFSGALAWVIAGGYALMFVGMVLEGPVVTAAGAFAAALGYFNIWIVLLLAIAGDLLGDVVYYAIGYMSRVSFVEKYGRHIGLTEKRMKHLERLIKRHPKKTMVAVKLAPFLPTPCLMMMGAIRMPFGKYAGTALAITTPKAALFAALGFYFGATYEIVGRYLENGEYLILGGLVITVITYYLYKKVAARVSARLETI